MSKYHTAVAKEIEQRELAMAGKALVFAIERLIAGGHEEAAEWLQRDVFKVPEPEAQDAAEG